MSDQHQLIAIPFVNALITLLFYTTAVKQEHLSRRQQFVLSVLWPIVILSTVLMIIRDFFIID